MNNREALEGIVVVDFSWALAGPWLTKVLAEHGATVIRIESSRRLDVNRRSGPYKDGIPGINRTAHWACVNNDKLDITLDLRHPRGTEIARKLVARGDIVVENFTPGTMKKLGLDYVDLARANPRIIMVSLSAHGQTGPHGGYSGYGWLLQALSGLQFLSGFQDRAPVVAPGPQVTDYIGSYLGIVAVMAALDHRQRTGTGQYVDLSQFEGAVSLLGPLLLDHLVNEREVQPAANRHPNAAPHGIYRCKGVDRWCAISISSDNEWKSLVGAIGTPKWATDRKFVGSAGRKQNEDELERLLEAWCIGHTAEQVMVTLQARRVPAGTVHSIKDVFEDPQLRWRGHRHELRHSEIGLHSYTAPGFRLSRTPCALRQAAPLLGQDNEYVYKEFLGMSEEEYIDSLLAGVFE